jgi:chemotaxis protein MotB
MLSWLLVGCALLRPDSEHLSHQLERELLAQRLRNDQLRAELADCDEPVRPGLDTLHTELLQIFRGSEVTVTRSTAGVSVSIPGDLLFAPSTTRVRAEAAMPLDLLAVALGVHPEVLVQITGHTDDRSLGGALRTNYIDNWGLSSARAASVARELVETYAVSAERLTIAGRGEQEPVADNGTAEGQAQNRRVVVLLRAERL